MIKNSYQCIGVMSGTSLDGVDLAHIHFTLDNNKWEYTLHEVATIPYPSEWIELLKSAIGFSDEKLKELNEKYTDYLGEIILQFIEKNKIPAIDAVCSHGHTILHQPQNGFTLQIGNLPKIAQIINQKVICDFRVQDVQLGGQGAPLVPIGDRILFSEFDYCFNLGGFSNISFEEMGQRTAFDISPVNTVLNYYANLIGFEYDDKGTLSRSGKMNPDLFKELNDLAYYKKAHPKSLGFEFVKEIILPLIENHAIPTADKMHTFTEHLAYQTSLALPQHKGKLLITGGGAYNDFMVERMRFYLPTMNLIIPDHKTLEYKEALIFALLGLLKLRNEINVLSSVTGASKDHPSGIIYTPN